MEAHADGIAHDPAPPAPPIFADRLALLRIDDAAIDLPHLVAAADQFPGEIEILDLGAVGQPDLAQHIGAEHAAGTGDDERSTAEHLLEGALEHDHRQLHRGADVAEQAKAAEIR